MVSKFSDSKEAFPISLKRTVLFSLEIIIISLNSFSVDKFPEYGKLSGRKTEDLLSGARVEVNPEKKNPLDFAVWIKAAPEHILRWESRDQFLKHYVKLR